MGSVNNENEFRNILMASIKAHSECHLVDIPDELKRVVGIVMKKDPALAKQLIKQIQQKPYDLAILRKGHYYALELKNEKTLTFDIDYMVKKHQIKFLKEAKKCGGSGLLLVRFKKAVGPKEKARLNLPNHQWAIDTTYICDIVKLTKCKLKKFPIEYFIENHPVLPLNQYTKHYELEVLWQKKTAD